MSQYRLHNTILLTPVNSLPMPAPIPFRTNLKKPLQTITHHNLLISISLTALSSNIRRRSQPAGFEASGCVPVVSELGVGDQRVAAAEAFDGGVGAGAGGGCFGFAGGFVCRDYHGGGLG